MLDALRPGKIAYVHQTVDAFLDFNEGAKIGHIADASFHDAAHTVTAIDRRPRVGFELFEAERNAPVLGVHLQDYGFHLIAGLDHFGRMLHAARPRHLADVDESLDAGFKLHERAVIGDVDDSANNAAVYGVP